MVRQNGMPGFTAAALAERAVVSTPLVQRYFPSRTGLRRALLADQGGACGARAGTSSRRRRSRRCCAFPATVRSAGFTGA